MKSSSQTKPANDPYEPTTSYPSDVGGGIRGADLNRIERLPAELRRGAEFLISVLDGAAAGDEKDLALLRRAIKVATPAEPKPPYTAKRVKVLQWIEDRNWRADTYTVNMSRALGRIDPAFRRLTEAMFDAARDDSLPRFAARLSCAVGALGDRKIDAATAAFEAARRDGLLRKTRTRAK